MMIYCFESIFIIAFAASLPIISILSLGVSSPISKVIPTALWPNKNQPFETGVSLLLDFSLTSYFGILLSNSSNQWVEKSGISVNSLSLLV